MSATCQATSNCSRGWLGADFSASGRARLPGCHTGQPQAPPVLSSSHHMIARRLHHPQTRANQVIPHVCGPIRTNVFKQLAAHSAEAHNAMGRYLSASSMIASAVSRDASLTRPVIPGCANIGSEDQQVVVAIAIQWAIQNPAGDFDELVPGNVRNSRPRRPRSLQGKFLQAPVPVVSAKSGQV